MIVGGTGEVQEIRIVTSSIACSTGKKRFELCIDETHRNAGRGIVETEYIDEVLLHKSFETVERIRTSLAGVRRILLGENLNVSQTSKQKQSSSFICHFREWIRLYLLEKSPLSRVLQ